MEEVTIKDEVQDNSKSNDEESPVNEESKDESKVVIDESKVNNDEDPFAYLERDFSAEKYKIEVKNMPKFYGMSVRLN